MNSNPTLRGMATASFWADDVQAATTWYTELLGIEPYFMRPTAEDPAYVEFRIGDYQAELGIISKAWAPKAAQQGPGGTVLYWHVDDIEAAFARVQQMGATQYEAVTERGSGFITASVIDPFGNILGLMYNPHYLEILDAKKA